MKRPAFTIIELMVILSIMVLLFAAGVPMLLSSVQRQKLKSSADLLRGEWTDTRIKAMEEGQIFCMRCELGGSRLMIDRVLDAHFTAGLSSRETSRRFDLLGELDPFEQGDFTGEAEDFILRDPSQATEERGVEFITLPDAVYVADVIAIPEERAAFYLGLTSPGEEEIEENASESEEVSRQEIRLGESSGSDGATWSAPIFFYPDGTTSAAAVLLKNTAGRCIELRLRGLTGIGKLTEITGAEEYQGELDATRERTVP